MRRGRSRFGVGIAAVGGALAVGAAFALMVPAFACTAQGVLKMEPAVPQPGTTARVEGANFNPGPVPVQVLWGGTSSESGTLLASAVPGADGSFSVAVAIPANAPTGHAYQLAAVQAVDGRQPVSIAVDVVARPAAPALVDQPAASAPAPAEIPAVSGADAPAATPSADEPVPAVAGSSLYGVAPLRVGASAAAARPIDSPAEAQRKAFTRAGSPTGSSSARWLLLPLGALGVSMLAGGAAVALREARRETVVVPA